MARQSPTNGYRTKSLAACWILFVFTASSLAGRLELIDNSPMLSQVIDINRHRHVVGYKDVKIPNIGFGQESYFWNGERETLMPDLPEYTNTQAMALSDTGLVAGYAARSPGDHGGVLEACVWDPNTNKIVGLGRLPGHGASQAFDISDDGKVIVGYSTGGDPPTMVPVVWENQNGEWRCQRLPTLHEYNPYLLTGQIVISGDGSKIAACITVNVVERAPVNRYESSTFIWKRGATWHREKLSDYQLRMGDINDHGMLTGTCPTGQELRAYVLSAEDGFELLDPLPGDDNAGGTDINNSGTVVGYSDDPYGPEGGPTAFIFQDGELRPLSIPGNPYFSWAAAINEHGDVAGYLTPRPHEAETHGEDAAAQEKTGDATVSFVLRASTATSRPLSLRQRINEFENEFHPKNVDSKSYWTLPERMQRHRVPGMSIAVIRNGAIAWARGFGVKQAGTDEAVDTETAFSVASLSKVATATATLRLVDRGKLSLDEDVNAYMAEWQVPASSLTSDRQVTLRRIMSHTAGLTVHGFKDFQPDEALPNTLDILHGRRPAKNRPVRVTSVPGTEFRYSGGGVTIEQQLIEESLGMDFASAADELVLAPLQMTRSTFENPLPTSHGNVAKAHSSWGKPRALPRGWESMPESAASGLWTTPSDYARLVVALLHAYWADVRNPILSPDLARDMMTPVPPGNFGLGPALHDNGTSKKFEHGGSNESYKAFFEANLSSGNGVVICTNGANGKALINEVRVAIARVEGWPLPEIPDGKGPLRQAAELLRQLSPTAPSR